MFDQDQIIHKGCWSNQNLRVDIVGVAGNLVQPKAASVVQDGGNFAAGYCLGKSHIDSHKDPTQLQNFSKKADASDLAQGFLPKHWGRPP